MARSSGVPERFKDLTIEYVQPERLIPNPRNARIHSDTQIAKLKATVSRIGFTAPILADERLNVLAGHLRLIVGKALNMTTVPVIRFKGLNDGEKSLMALADNKLNDLSTFDMSLVMAAIDEVISFGIDTDLTGFEMGELDFSCEGSSIMKVAADPADVVTAPDRDRAAITQPGDLWQLGKNMILCGDALLATSYEALLGADRAQMAFTDLPYNVSIRKHASGLGKVRHPEFAIASGELSRSEFTGFLTTAMAHMATFSVDGAIHFHCMDGAHLAEILAAGDAVYSARKALCVWDKGSGGMGSLYRHQEEFVLVFKNGTARHINNIQLGKFGRYRTTIWKYPGLNSFQKDRDEQLSSHPTCKPVALVADAIKDCSKRGGLILDPFAGSGTTIIAAERTGRRAAAIEVDPYYVDTTIRRWQKATGKEARRLQDGSRFAEIEAARLDAESMLPLASEESDHD